MHKNYCLLFVVLFSVSCQLFETEKVTSETYFEEEVKRMSWNDVDVWPVFPGCDETDDKQAGKSCFESVLIQHLQNGLVQSELVAVSDIYDTVYLSLESELSGDIRLMDIAGDSATFAAFPRLKQLLWESADSIPRVAPALKRGVPVTAQLILPLVVKTE